MDSINRRAGQAIRDQQQALARSAMASQCAMGAAGRWGMCGGLRYEKGVRDQGYHLAYLAEAIVQEDVRLFEDYVVWLCSLFAGLGFESIHLLETLESLERTLGQMLPAELAAIATPYVQAGSAAARRQNDPPPSALAGDGPLQRLARNYLSVLLDGDRHSAGECITFAIDAEAYPIEDLYLCVFQATQYEIGRLWQLNRITVAQEHYCTAATQAIMSQLYPRLFARDRVGRRLVATCVGGELHELGARMVADFFEMAGWDTYYLGANMPADEIVRYVDQRTPDVVAISATMTFHLDLVVDLVRGIRTTDAGRRAKILCGGYPFNISPDLWQRVGADGTAMDGRQAVWVAEALLGNEAP